MGTESALSVLSVCSCSDFSGPGAAAFQGGGPVGVLIGHGLGCLAPIHQHSVAPVLASPSHWLGRFNPPARPQSTSISFLKRNCPAQAHSAPSTSRQCRTATVSSRLFMLPGFRINNLGAHPIAPHHFSGGQTLHLHPQDLNSVPQESGNCRAVSAPGVSHRTKGMPRSRMWACRSHQGAHCKRDR